MTAAQMSPRDTIPTILSSRFMTNRRLTSFSLMTARASAISSSSWQQAKLWVRPLDSLAAHELPGTDTATFPFWSPDSRTVAFFAAGKLRRIDVNTGVSAVICDVGAGRGGTWNEEGTILFNSVNDGPLLRVNASGGTPAPITRVDQARSENSHRFPFFLPDGRKFLFYVRSDAGNVSVYINNLMIMSNSSLGYTGEEVF